jgi:rod shape-determining protein MreD
MTILQSAVFSQITLLQGTADVMLLTLIAWTVQERVKTGWQWSIIGGLLIDFISGLPFGIFTGSYLIITALTITIRERIWRFSLLVYLLMVVLGTLITHALSMVVIVIQSTSTPILPMLQTISLPSLILNLILSIPVYTVIQEIAFQIYPEEIPL